MKVNELTREAKKRGNLRALLALAGIKQVEISRSLHVTKATISQNVSGTKKSMRVRLAILKALHNRGIEVEYEDLWPNNHGKKAA